MSLTDIYHTLFRHKWKILAVWSVGIFGAAGLWLKAPVRFQSEAELYIPYVFDSKASSAVGPSKQTQTTDYTGQGIMNSEVEILSSFDLALAVADKIGADRILARAGGGSDRNAAAMLIRRGLTVEVLPRSQVIRIVFTHPDNELVQPLLNELISSYRESHAEIHKPGDEGADLDRMIGEYKGKLIATEKELRDAKLKANVTTLEDTKKIYNEQIAKIGDALRQAQADLAGHQARLDTILNKVATSTNSSGPETDKASTIAPPDKVAEYRRICGQLFAQEEREKETATYLRPESPALVGIREQIAATQKLKAQIEKEYPGLINSGIAISAASKGERTAFTPFEILQEQTNIERLKAEIRSYETNLAMVRASIAIVNDAEPTIRELERTFEALNTNYREALLNRDRNRFDQSSKTPNIRLSQSPSPAFTDLGKLRKKIMMLLVVTFGGGIALAFLLEMYLDRSFKRPSEVEGQLSAPLFMSIPHLKVNGRVSSPIKGLLANSGENGSNGKRDEAAANITPIKSSTAIHPFFEALRDRLIMYFEARNMTHKPKLVAVTSCGQGSGVSTVASGLAASLSETGDGNVLLVNMQVENTAAQYFHKGKLACDLDQLLEGEKREDAMVTDNLYVVAGTNSNERLPKILHKRFSTLMPKLRASDYDYIIFDMPPVTQISPTSRLARFMDMVFMVVEAEKTDRDAAKRATQILTDCNANVGVVLNKHRNYLPHRLQQDI